MDLFHLNIFPLKELLVSVIEEIIFLRSDFFFIINFRGTHNFYYLKNNSFSLFHELETMRRSRSLPKPGVSCWQPAP